MRKLIILILLVLGGPIIWLFVSKPTFENISQSPKSVKAEQFTEIKTPFTHKWAEGSHPFTGAAVIDVDGDGKLEVFVGGGRGQEDMLLSYKDGALVDITKGTGLSDANFATHGMASSDMDGDGDIDLVVARENAVTLYVNEAGVFTSKNIPLSLQKDAVPLSVAVSDVNGDGLPDIYVSVFVSFPAFKSATFNDPFHAKQNVMLINKGGLTFEDQTAETGTAGINNTFHTVFADLDRNGSLEMILSQNTGEVEILTPGEGGRYRSVPTGTGYGFWMGLAIADYDKDGDEDIFASNVGTSIPDFLTSGDLKKDQRHNTNWIFMQTAKALQFTDVTGKTRLNQFGFAWGAQFEDLNLDGEIDLLVAQNYIKWFMHKWAPLPGKALLQVKSEESRAFYQYDSLGLKNSYFGQSPLIMDIDHDGRPDVLWLNMAGPLRAHLNRTMSSFIAFDVPDIAASQGAIVSVILDDGSVLTRQVVASTGLMTDPTPHIHFGLGDAKGVVKAEIKMLSGAVAILENPQLNTTHKLVP